MSSEKPTGYIDVRVFAHATEDLEKVSSAVRNILPKEIGEYTVLQKTSLTGHHGNPIVLFKAKITDKKALLPVLEKIAASLSSLDKQTLNSKLELHLEKRNLYLRFDKQSAYLGEMKFSSNDSIHFKIHFRNKTPEELTAIFRETGLLP